jgi:hypothetical protein
VRDHASLAEDQLAAVQSVEEVINEKGFRTLRVKQHDKLAVLSLLAKVLGMLTNKTEISGPGGQPVRVDVDASNARARIEYRSARLPGGKRSSWSRPTRRPYA